MATEKDIALVDFLLAETAKGDVKWEATAQLEQFTTSLKGKYNVTIDRPINRLNPFTDPTCRLRLADAGDRELLVLTERDHSQISNLFDLARRTSLNVDAAIDEILGRASSGKDLQF